MKGQGRRRTGWAAAALLLTAGGAAARPQEPPAAQAGAQETIDARVRSTVAGTGIVIDRGSRDGVKPGDRVIFQERGGGEQFGTVVEIEGRAAVVRPEDPSFAPAPGVRATVQVPTARFEEPAPKPVRVPAPAPGATGDAGQGERDPKERSNKDEDWTFDMPLLAEVGAVKPWSRPSTISGRTYLSWDQIFDTEDERGDTFVRAGASAVGENLFGRGGLLHVDAEWNARRAQVPFDNDESDRTLRIDRLSYTLGGHRHDKTRLRFGRFLQDEMPEFGILDGFGWSQRRDNGDSYGASVGFLPEPDKDQESLEDFQLAAWYRWVADERERFTLTGGYQKTWHNGTRDRDLLVARVQYVPDEGWQLFSTAWVDIYGPGDDVKGSGPELTYLVLDARRTLGQNSGIDLEVRHQAYPELLRSDFPPVGPQQIQDAVVDRASGTVWRWIRPRVQGKGGLRVWGRGGAWADEEDSGGDGELGLSFHDVNTTGDRLDLVGFASTGKFSELVGGRIRYGRFGPSRSWSVMYEIRQNDVIGFENNADDLIQHRVRGSMEFYRSSGLSASFNVEAQLQDLEDQVFVGLFLQRSF